jgi:PAS domain S-box-containing protein
MILPEFLERLGSNVALVATLALVYSLVPATYKRQSHIFNGMWGLLFGLATIICMQFPVTIAPGVIVDGKTIIPPLAGFFFGPLAAAIAASIASIYRWSLGGVGALAGIYVIAAGAALGALIYKVRRHHYLSNPALALIILGIVVAINALLGAFILPLNVALDVLPRIWLPVLIVYPLGVFLIGMLLEAIKTRDQTVEEIFTIAASLRESEARFRLLAENSTDMISRHDPLGVYLYVSPACRTLLGYEPEELIGHSAFEFIHPDDLARLESSRQMVVEEPVTDVVRFQVRRKDGNYIWLESTSRAIKNPATGQTIEIQVSSRDITERIHAAEALQENEIRLQNLSDNLPGGTVYQLDMGEDGQTRRFTYISARVKSMHELTPEAVLHNAQLLYAQILEEDRLIVAEDERKALESMQPFHAEVRYRLPSGEIRWLLLISAPRRASNGHLLWDGIEIDITEQKKAEEKLRESEQRFFQLFKNLNSNFILHEIILDENGKPWDYRFLEINPSAEQAIGLKATDMIGKTARELFPGTEQYWIDKFGEVALSGVPIQYENYSKELNKYFDMRIYSPQKGQFALLGLDVTESRLAEEARRESEAKYRLIADNTADVIWVMDAESGRFKFVSPSVEKLRGYTPDEIMAQPVSEALTPESAKKVEELMAFWIPQFLANPTVPLSLTSEVDQPCKDGSIVNTEVTTTYVLNEQGKLEIVGVSRNITERKKIEKTLYFLAQRGWLDHGDNFFRALARYLGETLGVDYVFINQVRIEDHTAKTIANYWLGEIRPNFEYSLADTPCANIFNGKLCSYPDGVQQTFSKDHILVEMEAKGYSGIPLWDSRGKPIGLIALIHRQPIQNIALVESLLQVVADHTGYEMERQEAEAALRKERDRAQNYLDTVESLIVALDADGKITLINHKGCRMLGYDEHELIGKSWFETCLPQPDGLDVIYPSFLQMMVGEHYTEAYENPIVTRTGDLRQIAWHNTLLRDEQGKIIGTLSAGEDITERKLAQDELRLLNEQLELRISERTAQLEAANKDLESFSYSVSHDLRAPLRAVDGFSSMLQSEYGEQLSGNGLVLLERVRSNARRMGALIDDLLKFSRLGRQPLNTRLVDPSEIVQTALEMLKNEYEDRPVEFQIHELPACHGDPSLLTQVWTNLLSNALKYSQKRPDARIEVGCLKNETGENVYFVKDNGVGFDMRYSDKLFGVFQRLHSENEFKGTGVGLALVHRIVTRHGGRIWAESEPGKGSTFYFTVENVTA